jgi:hypothetical protein
VILFAMCFFVSFSHHAFKPTSKCDDFITTYCIFLFLHTFFSSWKLSLVFTIAATTFDTLFYLIQACVLFFIGLLFSHHYKIVPSSETNSKKYIFVSATLLLPTHKKGFHTPIFHD